MKVYFIEYHTSLREEDTYKYPKICMCLTLSYFSLLHTCIFTCTPDFRLTILEGLLCVVIFRGSPDGLSSVFHGHNSLTLLLVANNAAQGILSSFFFKFADTILKKYSSTVATIFTGLMSAVLFGHALSINFCIGVTIVLISMHLFFTSAPGGGNRKGRPGFNVSPSMDHISDKEAKMLKDDDLVNASIDERAQVILGGGADRAMLLPR